MKKKFKLQKIPLKRITATLSQKTFSAYAAQTAFFLMLSFFSVPDLLFCTASEYPFDGRYVYPLSFNDRSAFFSRLFFYDHP